MIAATPRRLRRPASWTWRPASRHSTSWLAVSWLATAGCIQPNPAHCGNNAGDASCASETPYCSVCVVENNGCVPQEAAPSCQATTATTGPSSVTLTDDATLTDAATDTDATTTTTSTTSATTDATETSTSTSSSTADPTCGDGQLDPGEQCDGDDLGDKDCTSIMSEAGFGGGDLACADDCTFDVSGCCLGEDTKCQLGGSPSCCDDLTCSLTGGLDNLTTCR
ncbi:MAG: hypothetical protein R3A79_01725 [Nannocystaceae bacterium]